MSWHASSEFKFHLRWTSSHSNRTVTCGPCFGLVRHDRGVRSEWARALSSGNESRMSRYLDQAGAIDNVANRRKQEPATSHEATTRCSRIPKIMALKGRDIALAGIAGFVAWGYATNWFPTLRWAGHAFVAGALIAVLGLSALILLSSRGASFTRARTSSRPNGAAFLQPEAWATELAALRTRQTYKTKPLYDASPKVSAALDELLSFIIRDFVNSWYSNISKNPVFPNEVDWTVRCALINVRDRALGLDVVEVLTSRLVPIMTAHFRDFYDAERSVRGRKLNRSITESEELDLAIASKYRDGKLHQAASLAYSDTKLVQQDYLRQVVAKVVPKVLPANLLASGAVTTVIREIVSCAILFPVMQILSNPDTWNQIMENYVSGVPIHHNGW